MYHPKPLGWWAQPGLLQPLCSPSHGRGCVAGQFTKMSSEALCAHQGNFGPREVKAPCPLLSQAAWGKQGRGKTLSPSQRGAVGSPWRQTWLPLLQAGQRCPSPPEPAPGLALQPAPAAPARAFSGALRDR